MSASSQPICSPGTFKPVVPPKVAPRTHKKPVSPLSFAVSPPSFAVFPQPSGDLYEKVEDILDFSVAGVPVVVNRSTPENSTLSSISTHVSKKSENGSAASSDDCVSQLISV